jgi:hypothetical protein
MERVVALNSGGERAAYSYLQLQFMPVIHDSVDGQPLGVFWSPGTLSVLDSSSIASSADVGAAGVFVPELDGQSPPPPKAA